MRDNLTEKQKDFHMRNVVVLLLLGLTTAILCGAEETRTWTFSQDGKAESGSGAWSFRKGGRMDGSFVRFLNTNVVILRSVEDGADRMVPVNCLSEADRAYLATATRQVREQKTEPAPEKNYRVEMKNILDFKTCDVVFLERPLPPPESVNKILRSELESAVEKDSSRNIVAMAFLGDDALDSTEYSGAIHYTAATKRVLTDDEYRGVKVTVEDKGTYYIETREDKIAAAAGKPERRWLAITLVFDKAPTAQQGCNLAVAEAEKAARQGLDATVWVKVGDRSIRTSWRPVPGIGFVDYNSRTKVIEDRNRIIKKLP